MKLKRYFIIVLIISATLNIIFLLPYADLLCSYCDRLVHPSNYQHLNSDISNSEYIDLIVRKSMEMDGKNFSTKEYHGLIQDLRTMKIKSHNETLDNPFNIGYLYAGLSYYALYNKHHSEIVDYLKKISNKYENKSGDGLNYKISAIVQIPIGIMYINLFKITKDKRYLHISNSIYKQLLDLRINDGGGNEIPYLPNSDFRYVDGVGMYVPFLMEYYNLTEDTLAKNIARDNIFLLKEFCVDKETGIPHHGYNPQTKIKLGAANWGRGIGWYLLALAYYENADDSLINTIRKMKYEQFPGQPSTSFDSSTGLMFEIFKQNIDKTRIPDINVFKSHTTKSGMIDDCSGDTYCCNRYSNTFSKSELCNGLFLILVSKFSNGKY